MKVGALEESITVSGEAPVVNVVVVRSQHDLQPRMGARTRRSSDSPTSIWSTPRRASARRRTSDRATAAQSLGNSTNENSYQIDGTDISSTPWLNTDAVEEVEVLQLGASAEYGNVQGAVFNIVTRQGGNVFHGDGELLPADRRADRPQHDRRGRRRVPVSPRHVPGRDASRRRARSSGTSSGSSARCSTSATTTRSPASIRTFRRRTTRGACSGSSTTTSTQNHRLMHGYHDDYYWIPEIAVGFTAPSTVGLSHGDNPTPNLVYTGVLSDKTLHRGAVLGVLAAQLERSERARAAARADRASRTRTPATSPAASRTGPRTAAGGTAIRRSCRT